MTNGTPDPTDKPNDPIEVKLPGVLLGLIPRYLENRRREVQILAQAYQKRDFQTIQGIGHKLKGNAASYGFEYLTEIGTNLESAAMAQEDGSILPLIRKYEDYLSKIKIVPA
jgi:HPt (histidine-containing phosphotransfer) domain-containing protein